MGGPFGKDRMRPEDGQEGDTQEGATHWLFLPSCAKNLFLILPQEEEDDEEVGIGDGEVELPVAEAVQVLGVSHQVGLAVGAEGAGPVDEGRREIEAGDLGAEERSSSLFTTGRKG